MNVVKIDTSPLHTNTYVVINEGRGFVVDPGDKAKEIANALIKRKAKLEAILLTHAHFDHMAAVSELKEIFDARLNNGEVAIILHKADTDKIHSYKNLGFALGVKVKPFTPDILISGGETLHIAGLDIKVIHTPGHTKGGVCYVLDDVIFSGDTLFTSSYGRTDLYDGDFDELKNSIINKLFRLQGEYEVLPGHGEPTSLELEKLSNQILHDERTATIVD